MSVIFINPYRFAASSLLLDLFPNAAAAYSLRQLRTGVTSVVRVRRSSDNTEQDFTAAQVTDGTLTTFCGSGNGFVRTWYDQSGNNNNVGQSNTAAQPQLVAAGAVLVDSAGKPRINFISTTNLTSSNLITGVTVIEIVKFDPAVSNGFTGLTTRVASNAGFASDNQANNYFMRAFGSSGSINIFFSQGALSRSLHFSRLVDGSFALWSNGVSRSTSSSVINYVPRSSQGFCIGLPTGGSGSTNFRGDYTEVVIYSSDVSSSRVAIESNINTHYSIY